MPDLGPCVQVVWALQRPARPGHQSTPAPKPMIAWTSLLLPALLAAVAVFFASSIIHMVLPWHKGDYKGFKNEDEVRAVINRHRPAPGQYMVPYCTDGKQARAPEMLAKYQEGPVGNFYVRPSGNFKLGAFLGAWIAYCLVLSLVVGYLARAVLLPGADFMRVLQVVGVASWLGYAFGEPTASIWKGQAWGSTVRYLIDGLVYAGLSGAIFAALWPS